jgi:hypothetical protein
MLKEKEIIKIIDAHAERIKESALEIAIIIDRRLNHDNLSFPAASSVLTSIGKIQRGAAEIQYAIKTK